MIRGLDVRRRRSEVIRRGISGICVFSTDVHDLDQVLRGADLVPTIGV